MTIRLNPDVYNDEPSQQVGSHTGGKFPPANGTRRLSEADVALSGNDKGNPVSTGKGGIKASLRIKNAGSHDAEGVEKTVNLF